MEEAKKEKQATNKLNIYQKMDLVRVDVGIVSKNIKINAGGYSGYQAVSETDVIKAVNEAEHKHGLISFQEKLEIIEQEKIEKEGKGISYRIRVRSIVKVINIDNPSEFIYFEGLGDGLDYGDKACGKANTYAMKYALLRGYKIPTGEDPDYFASPEPMATEEQVNEYIKLIGADNVQVACKKFGIESLYDFTAEQLSERIRRSKEKIALKQAKQNKKEEEDAE